MVYIIKDSSGFVDSVFLGNGDEISVEERKEMADKLARIGYTITKRETEPMSELRGQIEDILSENQ